MKYIAILLLIFSQAQAQDVSKSGAYKDIKHPIGILAKDSAGKYTIEMDMQEAIHSSQRMVKDSPMVFWPSAIGTVECYFGKYYLTDKGERHIEISKQLAESLVKSYQQPKEKTYERKQNSIPVHHK